jgi:predicted Zn-dependent peptidase
LLDFNEALDDNKKRKFEEFKARQAMRQKLRSRSKPKQEPEAPSEQFRKYAVLGGGKAQKPDRIIIRKL